MIFIVEQPESAPPRCWFAYGEEDFLRKVCAGDPLPAWEVHDIVSARELLEMTGRPADDPALPEALPALWALAATHGWDTPLYRADHLLGAGQLQPEPVSPLQAGWAALRARGGQWRLYGDEAAALAAADAPDPLFDAPGGWRARWALREQLMAVEVLADGH